MEKLYKDIEKRLEAVDFSLLWNGFSQYEFALYNSDKVCFKASIIPWDNRFIGNTAIEYEGRYIAIWNIENGYSDSNQDLDYLTASMIHEMFHAYQVESGEVRFPDDLSTMMYPQNILNFQLKYEENKLLRKVYECENKEEKIRLLNQICDIRNQRSLLIGDMIQCEYLTETAEGMAVYVAACALRQLSEQKYKEQCQEYVYHLAHLGAGQFDIRMISYYAGAILLLTAQDAQLPFYHDIAKTNIPVYPLISRKLIPEKKKVMADDSVKEFYKQTMKEKIKKIADFMKKISHTDKGNFYITGYDPMNMFRVQDTVFCSRFVRLTDNVTGEITMLMGETLLEMKPGSKNIVTAFGRA